MGMSVRTNIASMMASGKLNRTQKGLGKSLEKISSGLRINRAADDAAGLGVATSLETAVIGTQQAMRNTNDGISIIQTTESATQEVTDMLQRMRELAVQSASETLADEERSYISDEFNQLRSEIARIASVTEFNGISLTDGNTTQLSVQVGINNNTQSRIAISLVDLTTSGLAIDTMALGSVSNARSAIDTIDTALASVNSSRSVLGAVQNRLDSSLANNQTYMESLSAAGAQILDTDFATETSNLTKLQIMQQAGVASLAQAKNINQSVISLLS
jgi:flagellin